MDALVIYKLDRLTRSVIDLKMIVELLEKHGMALVSLQESLDATSPTGRLMLNLLSSVSQWVREVTGERTREAMHYLKEKQKARSRPWFGYDIRRGKFTPNPKEQTVIKQIPAWRKGKRTYREIVTLLNENGVPTKRGGVWQSKTVQKIVTRVSA